MAGLRTEFPFTLPKGFVADDGTLHRNGVMRLATARDEIEPLRDRSIDGPDDPYLTILVLARVITKLGNLPSIGNPEVEGLFAADLAFLQDLYGIINFGDQADVAALQASVLPTDEFDDDSFDDPIDAFVDEPADDASLHTGAEPDEVDPAAPAANPRRGGRIEEVSRSGSA